MVEVAPILGPFLARPPTPPRESSTKLSNDSAYVNGIFTANPLLDTPDESPASSAEYFKGSSGKARKKVGFSGWTQYHRHSPAGSKSYDSDEHRRRPPPSRECNPAKSILKPYIDTSLVESKETSPFDQSNLPSMLRSAALHLASNSRSAKVDAYTSLLGCLSAYEDVPDPQELAERGGDINGALRRDVVAKHEDGTPDVQLAAHALKLVTVLLCMKGTSNLLPDEFCSFIVEQSIACMEDPNSPKMLVSHYMHLIEKQKFSPKILTTDRVTRLLSVLGIITTRVKGNRVVCHRLNIYQRLLNQARALMVSRVGSWIDNLVSGMMSTIKEVRARAIAFGIEAGLQFGTIASVSQECMNVFNRQSAEGMKVVDFLASRLTEMTKKREDGAHVPQIWSVVLLFFRSRTQQIEHWEHLKLWLGILQQCFNSGDAQIKFQANIAWNRFIFSLDISMSTSISMAKMLKQPIVSQLERKSTEKNAKLAKQIARSSYCTLLYYALRPSATHAQLDQYWDLYIMDLLPKAFSGSPADVNYACTILASLFFNNSQPRIWDAEKANASGPMRPDDLPVLDPRWLRSKTESILVVLKRLFEIADWKDVENCSAVLTWRNFMSALGTASSKEVKVSMSTMTAVAKIVNCLKTFLIQQDSSSRGPINLEKFNVLLKDAIAKIGHIPFNEKRLLMTQSHDFEAAGETPSSRGMSRPARFDSAATYLVELLLETKAGHDLRPQHIAAETILHLNLQNTSSRRSRVRNLRNIARHILPEHISSELKWPILMWNLVAKEMMDALALPKMIEKHNESPEYSGHEYRDVVKVLELGIHIRSQLILEAWTKLFDCLCEAISKEVGNIGVVLVVQEPLAETICAEVEKRCDEVVVGCGISLLKCVQWPVNSKVIENAQTQLWGVQPIHHKPDLLESLKPCQRLASALLQATYASTESTSDVVLCSCLSTAITFVNKLPRNAGRQCLNEIQQAFGVWIEDATTAITKRSSVFDEVKRMYGTLQTIVESADKFDNTVLAEFENLLVSCLGSRHKYILNQSVNMWNRTFGGADALHYSERLRNVLSKLRRKTEIHLPDFPDLSDGEVGSSPMLSDDSEGSEEEGVSVQHATPSKRSIAEQPSPRFSTPARKFATASPNPASASKGSSHLQSERRDVKKTTPIAKLRHDNSQIHFAAIESSPIAEDNLDLQVLTDRQKEVKERQGREATLFPEIRSSPKVAPVVPQYRLPSLSLNAAGAPSKLQVEDSTSPSFPPDAMMNEFLGSSPTPSSSRKRSEEPVEDDGPPSSPPMISSHLQVHRTVLSPEQGHEDLRDEESLEFGSNVDEARELTLPMLPPLEVADGPSYSAPEDPMSDFRARAKDVDTNVFSDMDIYVDAPSDPTRSMSSEPIDMDVAREQSEDREDVLVAVEDDPVTAQLRGEIAKAASRRSSLESENMEQANEVVRKRKATPADMPRKRRKDKGLASSEGEIVADCVLIDNTPTHDDPDKTPAQSRGKQAASQQPSNAKSTSPAHGPQEGSMASEAPAPSLQRVRVKTEPGTSRRSKRVTRTSSRLYDIPSSSPTHSDSFSPSQSQADVEPLPWVPGPRGSRWAYIPTTSPNNAEAPMQEVPEVSVVHDGEAQAPQGEEIRHVPNPTSAIVQAVGVDIETPTAESILQGFRDMLDSVKKVALRPEEERKMVGILFESVHQVHEAGRRNTAM